MSNISQLREVSLGDKIINDHRQEDHEGYKLLSENTEIAFSLCKSCLKMNFYDIQDKTFACIKCEEVQTA